MPDPKTTELFDVIAISIKTGARRVLATRKTKRNAEAIVNMAVMHRGVGMEFYDAVPHGSVNSDV